jgi:hypothetical protein
MTLTGGSPGLAAAVLARLMIDVGIDKAGAAKLSAAKPKEDTACPKMEFGSPSTCALILSLLVTLPNRSTAV